MVERVLSLDMSTKTGWAFMLSGPELVLEGYGQFDQRPEPKDVSYPASYVAWANEIFADLESLVRIYKPDILVIEETAAGSKSNYSQKILEFIHFLVASHVTTAQIKTRYFLTEEWRRICGCKMNKEESKHNKEVRDYKKKHKAKLARNADGKIIGIIGRKHVNVRRANEIFSKFLAEPLRKKDEDTADALLLGASYHIQKTTKKAGALVALREQSYGSPDHT